MIPQELIERALALTGKTIDYVQEYDSHGQNWFSIEKFCYYLFSDSILEKITEAGQNDFPFMKFYKIHAIQWLGNCIREYQKGNKKPIISLLEKI